MTLILGIDTSADVCAVALVRDGETVAAARREMSRGHAEALMPMVVETVAAAGAAFADLDVVGVTVGPGSFTGVRTGLAAARGLAIASGARAVGVSALQAVAAAAFAVRPDASRVVCILETRRRDYYVQAFAPGDAAPVADGAPAVLDAAAARAAIGPGDALAGNAVRRFLDEEEGGAASAVVPGCETPPAETVARLAGVLAAGNDEKLLEASLAPLYLRPPEAKLPKNGGRLRR